MTKILNLLPGLVLATCLHMPMAQAGFMMVGAIDGSNVNTPANLTINLLPYSSTGAVLVPTSSLQDTGINLPVVNFDSGGGLYCKDAALYSSYDLRFTHNLVPGPVWNGRQLFKTSLQGLYFDVRIAHVSGAYVTFSPSDFYLTSGGVNTRGNFTAYCGPWDKHAGGMNYQFVARYYTDASFSHAADRSNSNNFLATFAYQGTLPNAPFSGPGMKIANAQGHGSYWTISLPSRLYISPPTCYATAISGPYASGSTVNLGTFPGSQVQSNQVPARPFNIELSGCLKTTSATFRLTTNKPATLTPTLLGNVLTGSGAAKGAAVKIVATNGYGQPQLLANTSSSSYTSNLPYSGETYAEYINGKIAMTGSRMSVPFSAQLVRDGNATVSAGSFRASAIFSVTYN